MKLESQIVLLCVVCFFILSTGCDDGKAKKAQEEQDARAELDAEIKRSEEKARTENLEISRLQLQQAVELRDRAKTSIESAKVDLAKAEERLKSHTASFKKHGESGDLAWSFNDLMIQDKLSIEIAKDAIKNGELRYAKANSLAEQIEKDIANSNRAHD